MDFATAMTLIFSPMANQLLMTPMTSEKPPCHGIGQRESWHWDQAATVVGAVPLGRMTITG